MIKIKETIRFHHNKRNLTTIFCFESFCSLQVVPSKTTKFTLKENTHIAFPRTIQLQFHCQPGIIPFHYIFSLESSLHIVFPPGIIPSRSIFSLESFLHVLFSAWNDSVRRRRWCCGWCSRWWFGHQLPTDQSTFAEGRRDKGRSTPSAQSWRRGFVCQSPWCHQNNGAHCVLTLVTLLTSFRILTSSMCFVHLHPFLITHACTCFVLISPFYIHCHVRSAYFGSWAAYMIHTSI